MPVRLPPAGALLLPAALVGLAAGILLADGQPGVVTAAPLVALLGPVAALAAVGIGGRIAPAGAVTVLAIFVAIGLVRGDSTGLPAGPGTVAGAIGRGRDRDRGNGRG